MPDNDPKVEYLDAANNMRHYENLRFAQLVVFVVVMAGLIVALFLWSGALSGPGRVIVKTAGVLLVIAFWIMDERVAQYWRHFVHRAAALETELGFHQYTTVLSRGLVSENVVRVLFSLLLIFWIIALVWVAITGTFLHLAL